MDSDRNYHVHFTFKYAAADGKTRMFKQHIALETEQEARQEYYKQTTKHDIVSVLVFHVDPNGQMKLVLARNVINVPF